MRSKVMRVIIALTCVTISVCCIGSNQTKGGIEIPIPFDWEDYKQTRELLLNDFYATTHQDAPGDYSFRGQVGRLFDTGYPRAFWETLSEQKNLSEVYLALEVGSYPELYYNVHTVFRSGEEYFFARWSALQQTDSGFSVYWQDGDPVRIFYQKVDSAQVFAFLEHCHSAYKLLDLKSFKAEQYSGGTVVIRSCPTFYAVISVSHRNSDNMILVPRVRSREFGTLEEFRLFFDRLTDWTYKPVREGQTVIDLDSLLRADSSLYLDLKSDSQ